MKRSIAAVSAFALLAVACSSQAAKQSQSASPTDEAGRIEANPTGHVGDTLNLTRADGGKVAVTLVQIINPATVSDGKGEPGKTYVAVEMTIADTGTAAIEGGVNVNATVIGSDNATYAADLNDVAECTNFDEGVYHLNVGESTTGCVVFALPNGVAPAKVKYTPSEGFAHEFGEWQVS